MKFCQHIFLCVVLFFNYLLLLLFKLFIAFFGYYIHGFNIDLFTVHAQDGYFHNRQTHARYGFIGNNHSDLLRTL